MRGWQLAAALTLALPAPAFACEPMPMPLTPPTQAQMDAATRAMFADTADLVDYVVIRRATDTQQGLIRVTRSYKLATRHGAVLPIWTTERTACGDGDAERGMRGRMFLTGKAPYQYRSLPTATFDELARLKLVPAR